MSLQLPLPIIYPITSGTTTAQTTPDDPEFRNILRLVKSAVAAEVPLFQIREKTMQARVLYELTTRAAELTRDSKTRLLVNDRSDIACTAGADGVHLTSRSIPAAVVRRMFGADFLIGVSTHSTAEVRAAESSGGDFVLFGPIFATESKRGFGEPQGLDKLREAAEAVEGMLVVAIGGITRDNFRDCFKAGARGVAAIGMLNDAQNMTGIVAEIRSNFLTHD
jgi:thiamine-phosphate pyrophosphorylase